MKGLMLFVALVAVVTYNTSAQKVYIGCPKQVDTKPNTGFLDKQSVDLVITNNQTIPPNSKVECDGTDITQVLKNFLQSEFPSCKITQVADTIKTPNPGKIMIRISITTYQANLSKNEWTGSAAYHVMIIDNRNGKAKKVAEDISNDTSKPGLFGYKAAKATLFSSFDKSNQDVLAFIKSSLKD